MLTHGFLHIVGYDHVEKKEAKIMFGIQEEVVEGVFKNYHRHSGVPSHGVEKLQN